MLVAPCGAALGGKLLVAVERMIRSMSYGRIMTFVFLAPAVFGGCKPNANNDATHKSVSSVSHTKEPPIPSSSMQGNRKMIKLYKTKGKETIDYWEAWENQGIVTVHHGVVGDTGESRDIRVSGERDAASIIDEEAAAPRRDGFCELPADKQISFVIQYRLNTWGSAEDLDQRYAVEHVMNECLGWTGNGHCDGGDIGSGSINIFCFVVDPQIAAKSAVERLRKKHLLKGAIMAYEKDDDYIVLWPKDFSGKFSPL